MQHVKKSSKEQKRYENAEVGHELICESIEGHSDKWHEESVLIRMDSPSANSIRPYNEKNPLSQFTEEYIKKLPEYLVKKIIETRSECSINCSRETKLLSRNNSYKGKIRELSEEIERLNLVIEDLKSACFQEINRKVEESTCRFKVRIEELEIEVAKKDLQVTENKKEFSRALQEKEKIFNEKLENDEKVLKFKEILRCYEEICPFAQIPIAKAKLVEIVSLQSRIQELTANNMALKDRNLKLDAEVEMCKLEEINKNKQLELMNLQIKALEENNIQLELRVQSLHQILNDRNKSHQDLIGNFKLLQDELKRLTAVKKKENPNEGEIERLKSALASKLTEKAKFC